MKNKQLKEFANLLNGYAFKSKNYVSSGIRIMRIANVKDGYICDEQPCYYPEDTYEEIEKYMLKAGDMLISLTGNVGRIGIMPANMLPAALNQRVSCIRLKDDSVNKKYLFYFFQRKSFVQDCIKASKGVAQLNLSTKFLEGYSVPVPPLPEQERIVARIEELFSELDKAVETLKTTKQQLAVYRQAVLKEAFEGNLTKWWREKNNRPYSFNAVSILDLVKKNKNALKAGPFGSSLKKDCYVDKGYKVYGQEQVIAGNENIGNYFIDGEKYDELKTCQIAPNDILISLVGTVGKVLILSPNCTPGIINPRLIKISIDESIMLAKYFKYYFECGYLKSLYKNKAHGATMDVLNLNIIKELPFIVCDIEEQKVIIKEIEARMSTCDSIEKAVDTALQQAEAMRQSILKQAFEGRL